MRKFMVGAMLAGLLSLGAVEMASAEKPHDDRRPQPADVRPVVRPDDWSRAADTRTRTDTRERQDARKGPDARGRQHDVRRPVSHEGRGDRGNRG